MIVEIDTWPALQMKGPTPYMSQCELTGIV